MSHFLIVYDQATGTVVQIREYADVDREMALEARFDLERRHRDSEHIEVVLLGADSREDLERTHGRYFKTVAQLADEA